MLVGVGDDPLVSDLWPLRLLLLAFAGFVNWQRQHEKGPRGSLKRDPLPDAA